MGKSHPSKNIMINVFIGYHLLQSYHLSGCFILVQFVIHDNGDATNFLIRILYCQVARLPTIFFPACVVVLVVHHLDKVVTSLVSTVVLLKLSQRNTGLCCSELRLLQRICI